MPQPPRLTPTQQAQQVSQELSAGQTVALGSGFPSLLLQVVPQTADLWFLTENGLLGPSASSSSSTDHPGFVDSNGAPLAFQPGAAINNTVDLAAILRGGHVDVAVVQAGQVSQRGDFTHWSTSETPDLYAPGLAVDLAAGARQVIAMLPHTAEDGSPNIVANCAGPVDGVACVDLIITDLAVIAVTQSGLELREVAPGWQTNDVIALTGAPLKVSPNLREISTAPPTVSGNAAQKVYPSGLDALSDVPDGAVVMIDGFAGPGGTPHYLLTSLRDHGARNLTIISNTAGIARVVNFGTPPGKQAIDHTILIDNQQVRKAIASYPVSPSASRPTAFELAYRRGEVELELVPQGTLAERLRAGGAGVAAFYTPTGVGTLISQGKETRTIDGREYVLEEALRADYCIIRGYKADRLGNVVYKGTSRNFNSVMAPSADITIVEVDEVVEPGRLDPEAIVTPSIYVDRIVVRPGDFSPYE